MLEDRGRCGWGTVMAAVTLFAAVLLVGPSAGNAGPGPGSVAEDAAIVRSTLELTRNLGLRMVAEGVEDQATWDALAAMGCELAQGYHLARPMPAGEATAWLAGRLPGRFTMPAAERG